MTIRKRNPSAESSIIVGCGHTRFGRLSASLEELIQEAVTEALADAGMTGEAVDAVWLGHFNSGMVADGFCSSMILGADSALRFKPAIRCENACASGAAALYSALDAVASGRVDVALVVGVEKMTHLDTAAVTRALGGASYQREEAGMSFPEIFSRYAQAYADRFEDPTEAMARIAVKNHSNALANPLAHMQKPLPLDFCLSVSERNPMIAAPLKVTDCSLITDGAAALVLTRRDRSADYPRAVGFRAAEQVSDLLPLSRKDLAAFEGPRHAFQQAYAAAGITVNDLDFAEVHDCFTIAELMTLEAMGLAKPGEAPAIVREGQIERGGRLPINLSGGLKAKGHPVGATGVSMHVLAARQLTGRAGKMQLDGAELGLCFNMGGGAVTNCVSVLEPLKA
ncbi:thiolase domain-containing protein [Solimonas marina]|uniref:Thiolase domain-containing protein n=1 Tax=Solimonas marina TaxID=2714601 RepID=A0A970B664_9GAMM|nr:thiolase domain-containing protein [Solimonas marina]NKF24127.1 thiolase domain-containing protein [Solimonas marina]